MPDRQPAAPNAEEAADASQNKLMGVLSYILFLIPLLAAPKESKFARYHANQGLVLFIAATGWVVVASVLDGILLAISWRLTLILGGIIHLTWFAFLALSVIGILNAVNGRCRPLPVIGGIQILK